MKLVRYGRAGAERPGLLDPDGALREIEEETGMRCELGAELPEVRYMVGERRKLVRYWLMRPLAGEFVDDFRTVDGGEYLAFFDGVASLHFQRDRTNGSRIQRRGNSRDNATGDADVAHEVAPADGGVDGSGLVLRYGNMTRVKSTAGTAQEAAYKHLENVYQTRSGRAVYTEPD